MPDIECEAHCWARWNGYQYICTGCNEVWLCCTCSEGDDDE